MTAELPGSSLSKREPEVGEPALVSRAMWHRPWRHGLWSIAEMRVSPLPAIQSLIPGSESHITRPRLECDFSLHGRRPSHLELFDYKPQLASSTGHCRLRTCSRAIGPLSSTRILLCWAPSSSSPGMVTAERSFRAPAAFDEGGRRHCHREIDGHRRLIMRSGQVLMNTGSQQFGRPSMGAWVTYGLGSESQDLPAFVVFSSGKKGPSGGNSCWG